MCALRAGPHCMHLLAAPSTHYVLRKAAFRSPLGGMLRRVLMSAKHFKVFGSIVVPHAVLVMNVLTLAYPSTYSDGRYVSMHIDLSLCIRQWVASIEKVFVSKSDVLLYGGGQHVFVRLHSTSLRRRTFGCQIVVASS